MNPGRDANEVKVWEEEIVLPTYCAGEPDKNPMFLEKRVYQGSSGKVYPYPITDRISDERTDRSYRAVWMENEYLKILILPELGGRIHRAIDKTNGCDFVYYNEVIKPALVGLLGPWISGGIEFNWPQHHRPTTFSPVDCVIGINGDGSGTVRVSEVDQMYGTKGMASFTLYPGRAYIEIRGQLYNRTPIPQTFLWWANPAVAVNGDTQSVFPPDVRAVMDHGKRDVSRFPIATGTYYKHDYGAGVDISRYKNIPVPTSYMAYRSEYDFVGGYDHGRGAGILHVADHHVAPGKKQWTWGCGDFGRVWDGNLTDDNGPYIELMTGVYTDNQPDFTWLKPFEEKTFTQYFMPYKLAADVKNASAEVALNLSFDGGRAIVIVYSTARRDNARVVLRDGERAYIDVTAVISPTEVLREEAEIAPAAPESLTLSVYAEDGRLMLSYTPPREELTPMPDPAEPAGRPEDIATCEELYLTGLHIEQYRHATYEPDDYYREGLRRDPGDVRINSALGMLELRRGRFARAEELFRKAIERLTWKNPNPYDGEAFCGLGLALFHQGADAAYAAFHKATWTSAEQEMAFYYLAAIDSARGRFADALAHIDRSLVKNSRNMKARTLKGALLLKLGRVDEARRSLEETVSIDPFCYAARLILANSTGAGLDETLRVMGDRASSFIEVAIDLAEAGFYSEAADALRMCGADSPMLKYHEALCVSRAGGSAREALLDAARRGPDYCFPNRLEDAAALEYATAENPEDWKAPYYLGNLLYDKKRYSEARAAWEKSAAMNGRYPTVQRNLSFLYYNKANEPERALASMERAFELDPGDARVFLELDQLRKKLRASPEYREEMFEKYPGLFEMRDDLYVEYVTLLNLTGRHAEALELLMGRRLHPWEGGEGKPTRQYVAALTQMARASARDGDVGLTRRLLERALTIPHNLGEGKLEGAKDNDIYYYVGLAERVLGNADAATAAFERASVGDNDPSGMTFYNDQPPEMIMYQGLASRELGREERARERFNKLRDYGERHFFDEVRLDYFAVSLPDLQLFDDDLTERNRVHCRYLIAMGRFGLGETEHAREQILEALAVDPSHQGALTLMTML